MSAGAPNRLLAGLLALPALLLAAACTATHGNHPSSPAAAEVPFADCATLTVPPATAGTPRAAPDGSGTPLPDGSGTPLPDVALPCFAGGATVSLGALRGPAVVNLWASWCPPCRKELPAFQRLAGSSAGLRVVGVDTEDTRDGAASLGDDLGLTFPTLFDEAGAVRTTLRRSGLPVTLFVDGQGRVRHVDNTGALDDAALADLVQRHLSVTVPR